MIKMIVGLLLVLSPAASGNSKLKTLVTAFFTGTAAASDEELKQSRSDLDQKIKSITDRGLDPMTAASFELTFNLDSNADEVKWADTIGKPDLFFVLDVSGAEPVAIPTVFDGYSGQQINQSILNKRVLEGGKFQLHVFDTDDSLNGILNEFKNGKFSVGIPVKMGPLETGVSVSFKGDSGKAKIIRPDYIGTLAFDPPKGESIWSVSGEVEDVWRRTIGNFTVKQIPLLDEDVVDKLQSGSVFWSFVKWACIVAVVMIVFSKCIWRVEKS